MAEINPNIVWNTRLEEYFAQTGEKAHALAWLHKKSQERYSGLKNYTDLPVIVLGVLNGATSIGSNSLFGSSPFAPIGVGIIALITAILSTVGSYFKWAARSEAHRISALQYSKLYRFLNVQCSLPRDERMKPSELLKYTKDEYDRMSEIAPLVPPEIVAAFKSTFSKPEYKKISWPEETNGLEAITVYKEVEDTLFGSERAAVPSSVHESDLTPKPVESISNRPSPRHSALAQILPASPTLSALATSLPATLPSLPQQSSLTSLVPSATATRLSDVGALSSLFTGGSLSPTLNQLLQSAGPPPTAVQAAVGEPVAPQPEETTLYVPDDVAAAIAAAQAAAAQQPR